MSDPVRWEVEIPNQLDALMRAIEAMDGRLAEWGASDQARFLAQLAAEELGTNTIKYGYDDSKEHWIRMSLTSAEEGYRVVLEDDGHEFNPCLSPEPDPNLGLEERQPGGWGLSLIRRLSAGMEYERRGNRNMVSVLVPHDPAAKGESSAEEAPE